MVILKLIFFGSRCIVADNEGVSEQEVTKDTLLFGLLRAHRAAIDAYRRSIGWKRPSAFRALFFKEHPTPPPSPIAVPDDGSARARGGIVMRLYVEGDRCSFEVPAEEGGVAWSHHKVDRESELLKLLRAHKRHVKRARENEWWTSRR